MIPILTIRLDQKEQIFQYLVLMNLFTDPLVEELFLPTVPGLLLIPQIVLLGAQLLFLRMDPELYRLIPVQDHALSIEGCMVTTPCPMTTCLTYLWTQTI